jgi:uncharacterized protein (TIGR02271 family)
VRGVGQGGILVAARVPEEDVERMASVMDTYGPRSLQTTENQGSAAEETEQVRQATPRKAEEQVESIPVVEEKLVVGKRAVEKGGVRVHTRVVEQPAGADMRLKQEKVEVERVPVDRPVQTSDAAFRDRTLEMTESGEEPVIGKEARVVEEVRLKKSATEKEAHVEDKVRKTEVDVENPRGDTPEHRPT